MRHSAAKDLAQALFEEAGDALFLFDPETDQVQDANPMAERLSGFSREELLSFKATYLFRFSGQGGKARLQQVANKTTVFHAQDGFLLRTSKENVWVPVNVTITRLHVQPRTLALITARDMREQYEAHQRLQRMEAELRRVLAAVSDCLWSADWSAEGKWTYRYLSPVVENLTGKPAAHFQPDLARWQEVIHPDDRARWLQALRQMRTGRASQIEYRVIWPDQSIRWLRESVRVTRHSSGDGLQLDGVLTDFTERKHVEERLGAERKLLRTLIDNLPVHIFVKDQQSRFLIANRATLQSLGVNDLDEVIAKTNFDFLPREQAASIHASEQEVIHSGQPLFNREELLIDAAGSARWLSTTLVPLTGPDNSIQGLVGISHDITAHKTMESELRRARDTAEAASKSRGEFLTRMSHEIRTPINGVLGMTELTLASDLTPQQRENLLVAHSSGETLLRLINDILDFSKIEAGKLDLDAHPFNLRDTLAEALKTLAAQAYAKGLELACHVSPEVPAVLVGDSGRLRQVILNLVGNAIKFTGQGEVVIRVKSQDAPSHPHTDSMQTALVFEVADTGIGIPLEKQQAIFEPFEQADGTITRKYGGTGLGLAISAHLVSLMGGRMEVESSVGRGSRFHFTACFERVNTEASFPANVQGLRDLPALVVDDSSTQRAILTEILASWGMRPCAVEGQEALAACLIVERPFALVLLDQHMPRMDGLALAAQMRQHPALATTPLLLLASVGQPEDSVRFQELAIGAVLLKPIKQSELLNAILRLLGLEVVSAPANQGPIQRRAARALRILLCEDDDVNQKVVVQVLTGWGHSVTVAGNGHVALQKLEQQAFDLVLMDVQMPEMDGFQTTAGIRAREARTGQRVAIVGLTAHALPGYREQCLAAGMDHYLTKPIRTPDLFEVIERVGASQDALPNPSTSEPRKEGPSDDFDEATALDRAGGDRQLLKFQIDLFLEELPAYLSAIQQGSSTGDREAVRIAAHKLKGHAATYSAGVGETARQVEELVSTGQMDAAEVASGILRQKIEHLRPILHAWSRAEEGRATTL